MQDTPGHVEFVHRSWPADSEQLAVIRRELSDWLAPLGLTEEETADVVLAVDEAAANAVRHAYGPEESGAVELTLWTEPGTLSHRGGRPRQLAAAGGGPQPGERPRDPADEQHVGVGADPLRRPGQPGAAAAPDPRRVDRRNRRHRTG